MPEQNILKQELWFLVSFKIFWTYLISESVDFLLDILFSYNLYTFFWYKYVSFV